MKNIKTKRLTKRSLKDLKGGLRAAGTTTCHCDSHTYCVSAATAKAAGGNLLPAADLGGAKVKKGP